VVRAARRLRLVPEATLEQARHRHGSADYRAAAGVMRDVLVRVVGESYEEQLAALACPVRLVWGEADRVVPPAVAERALARLAAGTLTVLPGVGHDVPAQAPAFLVAAVRELLPEAGKA
jgi:pimeloyl-ACP methyl ester carboxylesterase